MPKTDIFEIRIITASTESWDDPARTVTYPGVEYYINGVPLLDMIREAELPYCEKGGDPGSAGYYGLCSSKEMSRSFARALVPPRYEDEDVVDLYCCPACGFSICSTVSCKFQEDGGYILMKDFSGAWEYPFEFRFTRENFFSEIEKLKEEDECTKDRA